VNAIGEHRLLIDGKLVDASGGGTFDNINPATEEVLGVTADGTPADMEAAIAAARRAFDTTDWATDGELHLGVGAGITWDSDPVAEWEETELKARQLLAVAGGRVPLATGAAP